MNSLRGFVCETTLNYCIILAGPISPSPGWFEPPLIPLHLRYTSVNDTEVLRRCNGGGLYVIRAASGRHWLIGAVLSDYGGERCLRTGESRGGFRSLAEKNGQAWCRKSLPSLTTTGWSTNGGATWLAASCPQNGARETGLGQWRSGFLGSNQSVKLPFYRLAMPKEN